MMSTEDTQHAQTTVQLQSRLCAREIYCQRTSVVNIGRGMAQASPLAPPVGAGQAVAEMRWMATM